MWAIFAEYSPSSPGTLFSTPLPILLQLKRAISSICPSSPIRPFSTCYRFRWFVSRTHWLLLIPAMSGLFPEANCSTTPCIVRNSSHQLLAVNIDGCALYSRLIDSFSSRRPIQLRYHSYCNA
ncbi:hypothetical protein PTI98_002362 [Pleurotus ostreatus]|nr:hypothetical protein PTI98_002362 [Pleurotus ostreatus]